MMEGIETKLDGSALDIQVSLLEEEEDCCNEQVAANEEKNEIEGEIKIMIDTLPIISNEPGEEEYVEVSPVLLPSETTIPSKMPVVPADVPTDQKLNDTVATEQSSIVSLDTSHLTLVNASNELFNDAVQGLGDLNLTSLSGIFHSTIDVTSEEEEKGEESGPKRNNNNNSETQTLTNKDRVDDEQEKIRKADAPFDEETSPGSKRKNKKVSENMSAIARMRYEQKHGTMDTMINDTTKSNSAKDKDEAEIPYDEIQKERYERWRRLKLQMQREEAAAARNGTYRRSRSNPSTSRRRKKPLASSEPPVDRDDYDGFGLQRMFQPLADALQQSHNVILDATDIILGSPLEGDEDDFSDYGDNDGSGSETSSCSALDEDDEDDDSDQDEYYSRKSSSGRRSTRASKGRKERDKGRYNDDYDSSESEDSQDTSVSGRHSRQKGANKTFLEDITGDGIHLVHHIPKSNGSTNAQQDVCVHLQISDAAGGLIEPKFVWEVKDHNHHSGSRRRQLRHKYEVRATARETISLFDVCSVQRATDSMNVNIHAYPQATPENSILITLNNGNVQLFEAGNEAEAKRFVHGLRWIEARLTFNIIVGNISVCSEMLSVSQQQGIRELTSEIMLDVTNQLVEKSAEKLAVCTEDV